MFGISAKEYRDIYAIVGAAMKVHTILGRGLEEAIYQEAMSIELARQGIVAETQKHIDCYYDGVKLQKFYVADFFCKDIVVEIKAVDNLSSTHRSQLFNYMRLTKSRKGLLINFSEKSLRAERYLYQPVDDDFVLLSKENYMDYIIPDDDYEL